MKGIHNSQTCTCQMCEFANEQERQQAETICNDIDQVLSDRTRDRRLKELLKRVAAFNDDPEHSDLDDEQPIRVQIQLGDVRFARGVLSYRDRIPELVLRLPVEELEAELKSRSSPLIDKFKSLVKDPPKSTLRLSSEPFSEGNPYQTTDPRVKTSQKATLLQTQAVRQAILDVLDEKLWRLHETQWYVFPGTLAEAEEKMIAERLDFVDEVIAKLCQT